MAYSSFRIGVSIKQKLVVVRSSLVALTSTLIFLVKHCYSDDLGCKCSN